MAGPPQKNVRSRQVWATRQDLRIAIVTWMARTHHRRHKQDYPGQLTPIEFENVMATTATQAA